MKRLLILASLTAAPVGAATQQAAIVHGTVRDSATRKPLQDAQITASGGGHTVLTDAAGRYTLAGLAAGTVVVRVKRFGYDEQSLRPVASHGWQERRHTQPWHNQCRRHSENENDERQGREADPPQ